MNPGSSTELPGPPLSPLHQAANAGRTDRQRLIREYESRFVARLVVMIDAISYDSFTLLKDVLFDCGPDRDLHLMIDSPGGVGEVAVRMARAAQSHCRELTVIVPDHAKSAATLLALGGHHILMAPGSDLGPIDPQILWGRERVAAKDIISAVEDAIRSVEESPETYPIYSVLLGDLTAVLVQQARSAMNSTEDLLAKALLSNPDRTLEQHQKLQEYLQSALIESPQSHAALFSADSAATAGLSVENVRPESDQWTMIWRLWTRYFALGNSKSVYESSSDSQVFDRFEGGNDI